MPAGDQVRGIRFGPFVLDSANARLYRGDHPLEVRGKTLAVLEYLVARAGQLVTKDELLAALWPGIHVSEHVLVGCVRELRTLFGDTRGEARYIETVYRRGYRWLAQTESESGPAAPKPEDATPATGFVGRDPELARLSSCLTRAAAGERQLVFIGGEAGIGKTSLVEQFLQVSGAQGPESSGLPAPPTTVAPDTRAPCLVARGQCVEQYGPAEPFLPLLDALLGLTRAAEHPWAAETIRRCLPAPLLEAGGGAGDSGWLMPERAVRLLAQAVEAIAVEQPLVLVVEDLHWSDPSTLDVLSYLAHRAEPRRLLILGTYRPSEVIVRRHPLRALEQQLRARRRAVSLSLGRLTLADVAAWLTSLRDQPPQQLVEWLYARTEGHPFFVAALLDALVSAGLIAHETGAWEVQPGYRELGVPESVRLMIEQQAEQLAPGDRALLDAASAAGSHFSAATVAAAGEQDLVSVEARCQGLARQGNFIRMDEPVDWPDGTVAGGYRFIHELYRSVLYDQLSPARARLLHQRIGLRLEQAHGARARDFAAELAVHFERGRDLQRALRYLRAAADHCLSRGAYREAAALHRQALDLLAASPDSPERSKLEMAINLRLVGALMHGMDFSDTAAQRALQRCREIAEAIGALPTLLAALAGAHTFHSARAELSESAAILPRIVELAERMPVPPANLLAPVCAAWGAWSRGDFPAARDYAAAAIALEAAETSTDFAVDITGYALATSAIAELILGNRQAAQARSTQAVARARMSTRPIDRATALMLAGLFHACDDDPAKAAENAGEAVRVAEEYGFRQWLAAARIIASWAAAIEHGTPATLAALRTSIDEYTALGVRAQLSAFLCLAADAHLRAGEETGAEHLLERAAAHVRDTGERWSEAEIQRLRGILLGPLDPALAEASFRHAIEIARGQSAKLWEGRARAALAQLT